MPELSVERDLSVCVVAGHDADPIRELIASLHAAADHISLETVIVCDNLKDGETSRLAETFPDTLLVARGPAKSYAAAMNRAMAESSGRYIAAMVPGVVVGERTLYRLLRFMDENPVVGIAGPCIVSAAVGTIVNARSQPGVTTSLWELFGLGALFPDISWMKRHLPAAHSPAPPIEAGWVSGDVMVIRREVLEETVGFYEYFRSGCAEADFCRRAQQNGWHVYYVPEAVVKAGPNFAASSRISLRPAWPDCLRFLFRV